MIDLQQLRNIDKGITHPALPNWKYIEKTYTDPEGKVCVGKYYTNGTQYVTPNQYKNMVIVELTKKG